MNSSTLYIHHHLGMGDHIICNGLVRSLVGNKADNITLFVRTNNFPRVQRMYADDPRIDFAIVPAEGNECVFVDEYIRHRQGTLLRLGFDQLYKSPMLNFDQVFYIYAGVPFSNRWDKFFVKRDPEGESKAIAKLNPTGEPYMFVHDDPSRGFLIDPPNPRGLKVIKNDVSVDIFDMIGMLEGAEEIQCMESSFRCLIESVPSIACPLFLHKMVRFANQPNPALSIGRKKWVEI